jgi:UDP-glucose 4-epimerase
LSILITGGAGYIGSHTVKYFQEQNEDVIVVDNLQSGHKEAIATDNFYEIDIGPRCLPPTYQLIEYSDN